MGNNQSPALPEPKMPDKIATTSLEPSPEPPWSISSALILLVWFVLVQLGFFLPLSLLAHGFGGHDFSLPFSPILFSVIATISGLLISHLAAWAGVVYLLRMRHGVSLVRGLALNNPPFFLLLPTFLGGFLLQFAAALLTFFLPPPPDFQIPFQIFQLAGVPGLTALAILALVMAPWLEEALFRGVLFPALRRKYAFFPSALIVTILFTGLHGSQTGDYWPGLLGIAACGYILAWLRETTCSLWPPIMFHTGFNATAFAAMVASV